MKESFKTIKKHFIESFEEIFETPNLLEKVCVWVMLIFTVAFCVAAASIPIILNTNHGVSGLVFLSYIVTVPIGVVLLVASANWVIKVQQE